MSLYKTYKSGEEKTIDKIISIVQDKNTPFYKNKFSEISGLRKQEYISIIKGEIERLGSKRKEDLVYDSDERGYNQALSDQISHLQSELLAIEEDKV